MKRLVMILALVVSPVLGNDQNIVSVNPEILFTNTQVDTSADVTPTQAYFLGGDQGVVVEIIANGMSGGAVTTVTPLFEQFGGNLVGGPAESEFGQTFTITDPATSIYDVLLIPRGSRKVRFKISTTQATNVGVSIKVSGW